MYKYPNGEYVRHITSFPLPVRSVDFHPNGEWAAICGDELDVRVIHLENTGMIISLTGHMKSVKEVAWEPKTGRYLATLDCDGHIKIWDFNNDDGII